MRPSAIDTGSVDPQPGPSYATPGEGIKAPTTKGLFFFSLFMNKNFSRLRQKAFQTIAGLVCLSCFSFGIVDKPFMDAKLFIFFEVVS